jgi:hypothetical protein
LQKVLLAKVGQWGNWVIQHLLENGTAHEQNFIMETVLKDPYGLSIDQFASKVVEKSIKIASKRNLQLFIDELTRIPKDGGMPFILSMMNNQYGNYVVQSVLGVCDTQQRQVCVRLLLPHLTLLRGSKYGQRVAAICEKHMRTLNAK